MQNKPSIFFPFVLVFYEIAIYLSNDMYLPAVPDMMRALHLSALQAQWTLTSWFLGSAAMPLVIGAISGRFGRRQILLTGGLFYVISSVICALTSTVSILLVARTIQGAMMATMLVPGYAAIHESYDQKEAIRTIAVMGSITIAAPALGPLVGSFVLLISDWRTIFMLIALLALLALILLYQFMPETNTKLTIQNIDLRLIIKQYWQVMTNRQFMLQTMVLGWMVSGFVAWITSGPLLIIDTFHYQTVTYGLMQAFVFGAYIFGNKTVTFMLERFPVNRIIYVGALLTLGSAVMGFLCALIFSHQFYLFLVCIAFYSYSSALCFAPLNRMIIESSDAPMGIRMAMFTVFFTTFAVFGGVASGLFYNGTTLSLASVMLVAIGLSFVTALMSI